MKEYYIDSIFNLNPKSRDLTDKQTKPRITSAFKLVVAFKAKQEEKFYLKVLSIHSKKVNFIIPKFTMIHETQ